MISSLPPQDSDDIIRALGLQGVLKIFSKKRIRNKLIIYYSLLILLPLVIIGTIINIYYHDSMSKYLEQAARTDLQRINRNIEQQLVQHKNLLEHMTRDKQILEFVSGLNDNASDGGNAENLKRLMYGYKYRYDNINAIAVFSENGLSIDSESEEGVRQYDRKQPWFAECVQNEDEILVSAFQPGENPIRLIKIDHSDTAFIAKKLVDKNGQVLGAIGISSDIKLFEKAMYNIAPGAGGYFYITDKEGDVIYSPVAPAIIEPRDKKQFIFVNLRSSFTGWTTWGVVSQKEILHELDRVRNVMVVLFSAVFVFLLILAYITSDQLIKPLGKLRDLMKKAEAGDLSVRYTGKGKDEVNDLGESFNKMVKEIEHLIQQVYLEQKSKRKAEIAVLQSNIKPHFLYNTLDTIHWMSKKYNASDIIETVEALATLFRVSLSKGNELIQVKNELEHARSYLTIQKVRYNEVLEYDLLIQPECMNYYVQKVILQPFIENAIYHGIKPTGRRGCIAIRGYIDSDMLVFSVTDNGNGISEQNVCKLKEDLNNMTPSSGYGMRNVHQRIVLNYGKNYGVDIKSEAGKWTAIFIYHPLIDNPNGGTH